MSDPVSALNGASASGFAQVEEIGLQGMITLRGDLSSAAMAKLAKSVAGVELPAAGQVSYAKDRAIAWMSPDELLMMLPYADVGKAVEKCRKALSKEHYLVADVSDARAVFRISGASAGEVLAKLAPVDLSSQAFPVGSFRRTRLAQVAAAFWREENDSFRLICFRSVADYVFGLLSVSAETGSEVGFLK